ncbi:unnamed protein product [Camellia sinensis]
MLQETNLSSEPFSVSFLQFPFIVEEPIFTLNHSFQEAQNPQISLHSGRLRCTVQFLESILQTVWKVGNDGIEAGANMVPDSVPRPIARISLTVVAVALALFVLKSVLSTAFFVLAVMGLIYFTFIALNKDDGPKGGGGTTTTTTEEDSLEEARRIMEKYK